ncbi:HAD family hydrolase [Halorientalis pallida]|uniref:HAD family hydrolase n=1 Tax=Halorientalis pallida TaxID=2479928 RepID=UPI003C6FADAF
MTEAQIAVAFDLDDTLYPESEFVLSGFRAVADMLAERSGASADRIYEFLEAEFKNGVRGDNFDRLLEEMDLDASVTELVEQYRTHDPQIDLITNAVTCLDRLADRPLALITDGKTRKQRRKIAALGLTEWIDEIYISEEFGSGNEKPATDMFEAFLKDTGHDPTCAVYIADNPTKDFVAPNELGMRSIWLDRSWGEYAAESPETDVQRPTMTVESLLPVPDIIRKWETEL